MANSFSSQILINLISGFSAFNRLSWVEQGFDKIDQVEFAWADFNIILLLIINWQASEIVSNNANFSLKLLRLNNRQVFYELDRR